MELTIDECMQLTNALNAIKQANSMSFQFAWKMDDVVKSLEVHSKRGQEEQMKLLKEFGDEVEGRPGAFNIHPDKQEAYFAAIKPIMEHSVEVDIIKFDLKDFRREKITIPAQVQTAILRLIIDDKD